MTTPRERFEELEQQCIDLRKQATQAMNQEKWEDIKEEYEELRQEANGILRTHATFWQGRGGFRWNNEDDEA